MELPLAVNPASLQSSVTLSDLTTLSGTLVSILNKTYGPQGQMTLLVSSTGQASMVKDGMEIMSSLHLSHPVAKVVLQATKTLFDSCGDGCKTMIFYTNALFSALNKATAKQTHSTGSNTSYALKNEMVKALHVFCKKDLPTILSKVEDFLNSSMDEALRSKDVSWILFHVISTYLQGCVPHQAVHLVAELVVGYLKGPCGFYDYTESMKWFSSCLFTCKNKPYSLSCLKSGVFLHRPVLNGNSKSAPTNLLCLMCPLDGVPSKGGEKDICLLTDPDMILQHRQNVTKKFLSALQDKDVGLIICSSNIPSYALQMCQIYGISVIDAVEESDIDFLCYITGKSPVTSCFDISSNCIMKVSSFTQIVDGSSTYSNVILEGDLVWKPRTIFLCAPSETLVKQLKKAMEKCIVITSHLLKGSNFGKNDCQVTKNVVCGGGYFEMVLSKFLSDFSTENASSLQSWSCNVLIETLMAPVHILYDNISCQKPKSEGWLKCSKLMRARIECENIPFGLDAKGQLSHPLDSGIIDVLSTKIDVLYSALSVALCLMNVESILSVSKPNHPQ